MRHQRSPAARSRRAGRRSKHSDRSREASHSSLDSYLRSLPAGNEVGDSSKSRNPASTRVVFQNINGIPHSADSCKQTSINSWLRNERVGIALLSETNTHWPSLPIGQSWNERMRSVTSTGPKSGHFSSTAFNRHSKRRFSTTSHLQGGCLASVLNEVSHRVKEGGQDATGLGRWSFIRLRGKSVASAELTKDRANYSRDLVVVSAYRPNPPGTGPATVWAQQKNFFNLQHNDIDPREAFVRDLIDAITKWRSDGCEVILGVDANEDLSQTGSSSFRHRMDLVGLSEAIMGRHQGLHEPTYHRNLQGYPIDGIFTTAGVSVTSGGYSNFDEHFSSDH
jgi:hypothetical protein